MKIKTLTGHLTKTNKDSIKILLRESALNVLCQVNRFKYFITITDDDFYQVTIYENQSNDYGKMIEVSHTHKFSIE